MILSINSSDKIDMKYAMLFFCIVFMNSIYAESLTKGSNDKCNEFTNTYILLDTFILPDSLQIPHLTQEKITQRAVLWLEGEQFKDGQLVTDLIKISHPGIAYDIFDSKNRYLSYKDTYKKSINNTLRKYNINKKYIFLGVLKQKNDFFFVQRVSMNNEPYIYDWEHFFLKNLKLVLTLSHKTIKLFKYKNRHPKSNNYYTSEEIEISIPVNAIDFVKTKTALKTLYPYEGIGFVNPKLGKKWFNQGKTYLTPEDVEELMKYKDDPESYFQIHYFE